MNKKALELTALSIRMLTIDAIEKAHSGHPGLALGCAEFGSLLFGEILNHFPGDPNWINRDRFILSAGHGSMLLYSLLFYSGYELSLDDIRNFRQLGSKTPGHPEYGRTPGVESTTGMLGQGMGNGTGMAIAEKMLSSLFNTKKHSIIDHYTFILASDGDLMEGVSSEVASLAGHLGLGKLLVFWDSNGITIDGGTDLTFTENVLKRFEAYHWQTLSCSAYDLEEILSLVENAKKEKEKPSLIKLESVIGKGSPKFSGSHKAHGGCLGDDEIRNMKKILGVSENNFFFVSEEALEYFNEKRNIWKSSYLEWQKMFENWKAENPELYREWLNFFENKQNDFSNVTFPRFNIGDMIATRVAGGKILDALALEFPNLVGGSADLTGPCFSSLCNLDGFQKNNSRGRYIFYGVREHAMGAISNGIALHGGVRPFCATFMVFSDYMRPSIRMAALMKLPVIYILTHDSVWIGFDGPTHQPVEHLASFRGIPGLILLRPADAQETEVSWKMALERKDGPTVIALTKDSVEVFEKHDPNWKEIIRHGAYIVQDSDVKPALVIIATGSEVQLALKAREKLKEYNIRVVSMLSRELFLSQDADFQETIVPRDSQKVVIEAGISQGWELLFVQDAPIISIENFGVSGSGPQVTKHLGIHEDFLIEKAKQLLRDSGVIH